MKYLIFSSFNPSSHRFMNVEMSHVLFRDASGKPHLFDNFFIHARNLRYVHIPPQVGNLFFFFKLKFLEVT